MKRKSHKQPTRTRLPVSTSFNSETSLKAIETNALKKQAKEDRANLIIQTVLENKSKGMAGVAKIMELFWEKAFLAFDDLFDDDPAEALKRFDALAIKMKEDVAIKREELDIMRMYASTDALREIKNMRTRAELDAAITTTCEVIEDKEQGLIKG